jgi:Asp-tRNA(Asn)/Glu-tRNA(Gln) amidotransferase A subunit family amidase
MTNLAFPDATALRANLAVGVSTAQQVTQTCLNRIAERDAHVRAWAYIDPEQALRNAEQSGRLGANTPLRGLPIGVKDVILTKDMPTQHNSPLYQGSFPKIDAACVSILRAAGAVILGKTDTVEFASTGRKALTRNPHDLARTPGGSSSGSAAAVADFHVPLSLGTQTGGSMIRPASFCGVFAMKPTWGLVSTEGAKSFSPTLDTIGWFARSPEDLALLYDVFDPEVEVVQALDLAKARIAVCRSPFWDQAGVATRDALAAAEYALRDAGATVTALDLPPTFERLGDLQLIIMASEGRRAFLSEHRLYGYTLHANIRAYVENAAGYSQRDLSAAYDGAARCRETFDAIASEYDAVLTPSVVGEAPRGLAETGAMTFNAMWTLLHVPCINVPGFKGPAGMPVGLTVTGPRYSDGAVLAAAAAMARAFGDYDNSVVVGS